MFQILGKSISKIFTLDQVIIIKRFLFEILLIIKDPIPF